MMILTTLFGVVFCAWNIDLSYQDDFVYKNQTAEILTASKLKKGSSIFAIDRNEIANNIEIAYPNLKAKVNLTGFNRVKITLSNRTPIYYFVQEGVYYVLDEDCKILDVTNDALVADKYIKLENNFSASESTVAGQFVGGKYADICKDLFKAMYMYLGEDADNDGVLDSDTITREDMRAVITSIKFSKVSDLYGEVDKITLATAYGVRINITQPQYNLGLKANKAFSALRQLNDSDKISGNINIVYTYDQNNNQSIVCEYRKA
jgi:hypothetical protein